MPGGHYAGRVVCRYLDEYSTTQGQPQSVTIFTAPNPEVVRSLPYGLVPRRFSLPLCHNPVIQANQPLMKLYDRS